MESRTVQMNLFAGQEQGHRWREQMCGHSMGGEGGMNRATGINIYTLPRGKQPASGKRAYSVLCDDLQGCGKEVPKGADICVHRADSSPYTGEINAAL